MDLENITEMLRKNLPQKRFEHSLMVMEEAQRLAAIYGMNMEKAKIAGLLHDCAKGLGNDQLLRIALDNEMLVDDVSLSQPRLLHGAVGAFLAEKIYEVTDKDILKAIKTHTTGSENMNMLQKIILIADYTEPGRSFEGVDEIRYQVSDNLDKAIILALDSTIRHVLKKGELLHTDTVKTRNYILQRMK